MRVTIFLAALLLALLAWCIRAALRERKRRRRPVLDLRVTPPVAPSPRWNLDVPEGTSYVLGRVSIGESARAPTIHATVPGTIANVRAPKPEPIRVRSFEPGPYASRRPDPEPYTPPSSDDFASSLLMHMAVDAITHSSDSTPSHDPTPSYYPPSSDSSPSTDSGSSDWGGGGGDFGGGGASGEW